ncbi:MAG: glycosyl transferase [Pseudomonadota bacterium]
MVKQIVCINWGTKYGAPYINRLYAMVARHTTPPFTFTAITDTTEGVRPEVRCVDLPPMPAADPKDTPGKWPKARLWAPELAGLIGPVLFLDLDIVITGSLDPFFGFGDPDDVVLARNAAKPFQRAGQTSIYRFPVGGLVPLYEAFRKDAQGIADRYRYEQFYVTKRSPNGVKFWPRRWVRHFRIECIPPFPLNLVIPPWLPKGARAIIFAGKLNPPDAIAGRWDSTKAHRPPLEHLADNWRRGRRFHFYRIYLHPTKWVEDAWRE